MMIRLVLAEGNEQLPIIILVVAVAAVMWSVTRRGKKGGKAFSWRSSKDQADSDAGQATRRHELKESMRELLLELEQLSREINSQVDTRLRALNLLIQEADQKIKELRLLQGAGGGASPARNLPPPRTEPNADATRDRYARVYALAERGRSVVEIAREMEMMTGEVELILALRRTAGAEAEDRAR